MLFAKHLPFLLGRYMLTAVIYVQSHMWSFIMIAKTIFF